MKVLFHLNLPAIEGDQEKSSSGKKSNFQCHCIKKGTKGSIKKNVTKNGKNPQFSWPPPPRMIWTFLNLGKGGEAIGI